MMRWGRWLGALAVAVAALLLAVAFSRREEPPSNPADTSAASRPPPATAASTAPPAEVPFRLGPTRRCLRSAGFEVSGVRSANPRIRALGDLAQQTSLELRLDGQVVGLALGDARLLAQLLAVPNDPYRLEVRRNAVLLFSPRARAEAELARACLSP
jgi:hypothetical protein